MKSIAATIQSPAKAAIAVGVSAVLAMSLALAAPATAQAKTVKKPAKVKKPTVSKVKATSFKVSWKKAKRAKGYQVKVIKGSKTVKTITVKKKYCYATGLKAKTTYKVKVRAYNQSGKKKKYGKWSTAKSVRTAKKTSTDSASTANADSVGRTYEITDAYVERNDGRNMLSLILKTKVTNTSDAAGYLDFLNPFELYQDGFQLSPIHYRVGIKTELADIQVGKVLPGISYEGCVAYKLNNLDSDVLCLGLTSRTNGKYIGSRTLEVSKLRVEDVDSSY